MGFQAIFLPGKFHGQRSLADYSPWGCKESDTTEQLSTDNIWKIIMNSISTEDIETFLKGLFLSFFFLFAVFIYLFFGCTERHVGSWFPKQGSNLYLLRWKCRVLTAGPPEFPKACFLCQSLSFELWCWRSLLRVPWTSRRFHQSILNEVRPELEGLMMKLKLQYFGHLM